MNKLRLLIQGFVLAGWMLLVLHQHAGHPKDLHPQHDICPICSIANRVAAKISPNLHPLSFSFPALQSALRAKPQMVLQCNALRVTAARAPPIASIIR